MVNLVKQDPVRVGQNPGTKNTHRYRHRGLKTADLESRRELSLSFLALINQLFP